MGFQFLWGWNPDFSNSSRVKVANFQFLWGWNMVTYLRMLNGEAAFNSFEDETVRWTWTYHRTGDWAFNSFEDETSLLFPSFLSLKMIFQFLWGWNKSLVVDMVFDIVFQFLWGWNCYIGIGDECDPQAFNSFEDETDRQRPSLHAIPILLSIPLRMKRMNLVPEGRGPCVITFNSFEDETMKFPGVMPETYTALSIPLRMKHRTLRCASHP